MIFFVLIGFYLRNYDFKKRISIITPKNKCREILHSLKKILKEIGPVFFEI